MNKVDVFCPCAPKDYIKLPYAIKSLIKHVPEIGDIHICTPNPIAKLDINHPIYYHLDTEVLPAVDPYKWKFRPNWIYQQMIKLFQNVTKTEYYLTYDVDGILIRDLPLFDENGKPIWYIGWDQDHAPYHIFNKMMLGLDKTANHTFISDMNLFRRDITAGMLARSGYTAATFIKRSQEIVSLHVHIGEPELYGQYCAKYHPDLYTIKQLKQYKYGKVQGDALVTNWTDEEIDALVEAHKHEDYDIIQMHSWCVDSPNYWKKEETNMESIRINLGCGTDIKEGYINVDINVDHPNVIKQDIRKLADNPNTVDEIYAKDILEHFDMTEAKSQLAKWARLLKRDGKLTVIVPNFDEFMNAYNNQVWKLEDLCHFMFAGINWQGKPPQDFDYHKSIYTAEWFKDFAKCNDLEIVSLEKDMITDALKSFSKAHGLNLTAVMKKL